MANVTLVFVFLGSDKLISFNYSHHEDSVGLYVHTLEEIEKSMEDETIMKRYPSALLLGASKCGSTTITTFLDLHPSIVYSQWPVEYHGDLDNERMRLYTKRLPRSKQSQVFVSRNVPYMYNTTFLDTVSKFNSSMRLLMIFSDPVERVLSWYAEYAAMVNKTNKHLTEFNDIVLERDSDKINSTSQPIKGGHFIEGVNNCYDRFPKDQIHIVDGGTFVSNPYKELQKLEKFLGIPPYFKPEMFVYNQTKKFFCPVDMDGNQMCMSDRKGRKHIEISQELRQKIIKYYEPYDLKLYQFTRERFSWMS